MNNYVYFIGNKMYLNITNKCSNDCTFCIRKGKDGINGQCLRLENEPNAEDVISQLPEDLDKYDEEVVFCGFGEPTFNLDVLEEVAAFLHCVDKTVRLNTNGLANLINKSDVSSVIADSCDVVNISLNAPNKTRYAELCKSTFGEPAFDEMLQFAQTVKQRGANVVFSIVDVLSESEIKECEKLAKSLNIPLRIRSKQ